MGALGAAPRPVCRAGHAPTCWAGPQGARRRCHGDARTQAGRARGVPGAGCRLETLRERSQEASPRSGPGASRAGRALGGRRSVGFLLRPGECGARRGGGQRPGTGRGGPMRTRAVRRGRSDSLAPSSGIQARVPTSTAVVATTPTPPFQVQPPPRPRRKTPGA
ncbi:hypothetical protein P7K49_015496 [Saguinus oedipus]|uniref:Uncharacterized protein n=1 Tax=Saguinus oedipus TaxID=9490 RepID=A0ABQ9VCA6_SAGOE|nr:hypothetical protein P7K49_015496 [Saguinus oedipus]